MAYSREEALGLLERALAEGRLGHAYLVSGEAGSCPDEFANEFAGLFLGDGSIRVENDQAIVGFNSRLNLVYDLEICTDLAGGAWSPAEPHTFMDGTGQLMECVIPIEHLRAFFRLIEYK